MVEQRDKNDDRDRNTKQPEQDTATHGEISILYARPLRASPPKPLNWLIVPFT